MGAAVAAALVVGAGLFVGRIIGARSDRQLIREFSSAPGSRTTVTLRDGTQFVLGPASRLRVPIDFGRDERAVELDGQALFTVVHDATHLFAVRTARTVVQDVGTTFVVRAYAGDAVERVAVAEGMVTVAGASLDARDLAIIDSAGRVDVRRGAGSDDDLAWTQGRLVFRDTPLSEVARELARAFDLTVTLADSSLGAIPVTGTFGNDPIDEVLDEVTQVIGVQYERTGRTVLIRRGAARARQRMPDRRGAVRATVAGDPTKDDGSRRAGSPSRHEDAHDAG